MPNKIAADLPPRLRALYKALDGKDEVPVVELYLDMFGPDDKTDRQQAQKLGTYIARLNNRLEAHGMLVEPGRTKYSYKITSFF